MARTPKQAESAPARILSPEDMRLGIYRLNQRISDFLQLNAAIFVTYDESPPDLIAMVAAIERTLSKTFGEITPGYKRYEQAMKVPAVFMA